MPEKKEVRKTKPMARDPTMAEEKSEVKDEQQRPPGCDWGRNSKLKTYRF